MQMRTLILRPTTLPSSVNLVNSAMNKIIPSIVGAVLAISPAFSVLAQEGTPPAAVNFCTRISREIDQRIGQHISEREAKLKDRRVEREAKLEERRDERKDRLEDFRERRDERRDVHYAKLMERATTTAQKAAVTAFQQAIESAVSVRKSAVDAANSAFKSGLDTAIANRKTAVDAAIATLKSSLDTAMAKAKSDCSSGVAPATAREAYRTAVENAQKIPGRYESRGKSPRHRENPAGYASSRRKESRG